MFEEELEALYPKIKEVCMNYYISGERKSLYELLEECMGVEGMPMHCPPHHFMIPAVLLTMCHQAEGDLPEDLEADLREANERAHHVLGGFCGNYGSCGAAVGTGIFMSIYTQSGPCSEGTWSWTNRIVAKALMEISELDGPRCCKRNSYLAMKSACESVRQYLQIELDWPQQISCHYFTDNHECIKEKCPFYPKKGI